MNIKRNLPLIIFCVLVLTYYFIYEFNSLHVDDSFITYRYAYNFSSGNGLVYNTGEKVFGTTSPLYALILGGLKFLLFFISYKMIHIISQLLSLISFFIILLLFREKSGLGNYVIFFGFLIITSFTNYTVLFSGMETFFIIYIILCLLLYDKKYIALLIVPIILLRIDLGLICFASYMSYLILTLYFKKIDTKFFRLGILFSFVSIILALLIEYLLFNSFLPNTIYAKMVIYKNTVFEQTFKQRFSEIIRMGFPIFLSIPIIIINFIFFIYHLIKKNISVLKLELFFYYLLLFLVAFITVVNAWYLPPLGIIGLLLSIKNFNSINTLILKKSKYVLQISYVLIIGTVVIILYQLSKNDFAFKNNRNSVLDSELYEVSTYIPESTKVFCGDIGIIGFYSRAYLYDYAGLVTPEAIKYNNNKIMYNGGYMTDYRSMIDEIKKVKPDFINIRKSYVFANDLLNSKYIKQNYELATELKSEILFKKIKM